MAKRKRARSERRRVERAERSEPKQVSARRKKPRPSSSGRRIPVATIAWSLGGVAAVALVVLALVSQGAAQPADAATEQLARSNSGTDVTVHAGSRHVVYHSDEPLPSASFPRVDGQPTLVWFSGTWCHVCEQMAPFAHETAAAYTDQLVFVEKSVDHDRDSSGRYGVRGTPTFIMLDAVGSEVTRFHGSPNATSFAAQIEQALAALS